MKRKALSILLVFAMVVGLLPMTVFATSTKDLSECEVLIDGESWKVFPVEHITDVLDIEDLHITVVDKDGNVLPEDAYFLNIGQQVGWDEDDLPIISEIPEPYGIDYDPNDEDRSSGFSTYCVNATGNNENGYTGGTERREFMIWHKYSFNWFGANATFGEGDEYKTMGQMTWHDCFEIPVKRMEPPVVHGISWEDAIDSEFYDITYYYRHDEVLPDVDPDDPAGFAYDEQARYPENDPDERLDGMPTQVGTYFARIEGKAPYYGTSYIDFDIVPPSLNDCELRFRGEEEWTEDYYLNSKDETLTLEQLDITVVDNEDNAVSPDDYTLQIGVEVGYDDDLQEPIIQRTEEPFGISDNPRNPDSGFCMYTVKAVPSENSAFCGETRLFEFMLRDVHTLERDSAYIDFGETYRKNVFRSWHYNFVIPQEEFHAPVVFNCLGKKLDPSDYTLTYFERYDEYDDFDLLYSETTPLDEMPSEPGTYFARIDGKEPYYGTSYVDFDIVDEPVSYASVRGSDRRYYDGETIYLRENSEIFVCFNLSPDSGLIPGWDNGSFKETGFEIDDDPMFDNGIAYAHIKTGDLPAGTSGILYYRWYRVEDVFDDDGGMHWDTAEPVMTCSVRVEIIPDAYDYLLGDADGDGEISIVDVTVIQRYLAGMKVNADAGLLTRGDVDADRELTLPDATAIQRHLAHIRIPYDVGKLIVLA